MKKALHRSPPRRTKGPVKFSLPLPLQALAIATILAAPSTQAAEKPRPLMRDFMGLCVHTVQFKPALYAPVTSLVRDYHPVRWDLGDDTSFATQFPRARNGVDWSHVYGSWKEAGYRSHASLMFDDIEPGAWMDVGRDAYSYGKAFGAAHASLLDAAEIGNEPGKYDDATYRTLFEAMARGIREGAPKMRIATCAANLGPSGRYSKSVDALTGLESLYDVITIHNYAEITGWPTWKRSYAEDPKINFLRDIGSVLTWRAEHAPDKEVWLTEFGWDATTKPRPTTGDFAKWEGSTETQQALWTVRGYLVLSATALDRAYLYFFNDDDTPHLHGSSGLTRNFVPKPAFHAVAHLQRTLGGFRFHKAVSEAPEGFVYEYVSDAGERILVVWKPEGTAAAVRVNLDGARIAKAERMPLKAGDAERVEIPVADGQAEIMADEAPIYLWLSPKEG